MVAEAAPKIDCALLVPSICSGGMPTISMAGTVISPPPPAIELTKPAKKAATKRRRMQMGGKVLQGRELANALECGLLAFPDQARQLPFGATVRQNVNERRIHDGGKSIDRWRAVSWSAWVVNEPPDRGRLRSCRTRASRSGDSAEEVAALASIDMKEGEPAILEAARRLNVPARFFERRKARGRDPAA